MKKTLIRCIVVCELLLSGGICFAGESDTKIRISCSAALEMGQIMSGSFVALNPEELSLIQKGWQERFLYRLKYDYAPDEKVRLLVDIEGQISFSYPQVLNPLESQQSRNVFSPERIEGMYTFINSEKTLLQLGIGYFPYKFNPDAKNLGEVLFRSGTYPLWIMTNFDHCYGKLLGFRLSSRLFGSLEQDLMLTSETLMFPSQDFSLSYVARYSLFHVLDIGAGVTFAHLISTDKKLTRGPTDPTNLYIKKNGDTAYYDFTGTKPAVVLSFDPKPLLPSGFSDLLGKHDGRIYGEVCVSGWENRKNYDSLVLYDSAYMENQYYVDRFDRTVIMFGCNIPTFKLLDVLSLEFEHFPNRYQNSYRNPLERNIPTPFVSAIKKPKAWKWTLYAKRTMGRFFITGQAARDHLRLTFPDIKIQEKEDQLKYGKDWWWVVSCGFAL